MLLPLLTVLIALVNGYTWYPLTNKETLQSQSTKYFVYQSTDNDDWLRQIKFTFTARSLVLPLITISTCQPVGAPGGIADSIKTGCLGLTTCDIYIDPCLYVPNQAYFVTVNLGAGLLQFDVTAAEDAAAVTDMTDGQTYTASTSTLNDGSPDSYAIYHYKVDNENSLNQLYLQAADQLSYSTAIRYTSDVTNLCTSGLGNSDLYPLSNQFGALLENSASCTGSGSGDRYILVRSNNVDSSVDLTAIVNKPDITAITDQQTNLNFTDQTRPIDFFYWDFPSDSYGTITFASFVSGFGRDVCHVSAYQGSLTGSPPGNYGADTDSCDGLQQDTFSQGRSAEFSFGPCNSGRWFFSVYCATVSPQNAAGQIQITTATFDAANNNYQNLDFGTPSAFSFQTAYYSLQDTSSNDLDDGTSTKQVVQFYYNDTNNGNIDSQIYLARSLIDPERGLFACSGVDRGQRVRTNTAVITFRPCALPETSGDLNAVIVAEGGGGNTPNYRVTAFVENAQTLDTNSSIDDSTPFGAAYHIYDVKLGAVGDLTIITVDGAAASTRIGVYDSTTCETISSPFGQTLRSFCTSANTNAVYYVQDNNVDTAAYTIQATTYASPNRADDSSSLRKFWADTVDAFTFRLDSEFIVVDVDIPEEAWTLEITGNVNIEAGVVVLKGCEILGQLNCNGLSCSFDYFENVFNGRLRIAFVALSNPSNAQVTLSYTGGLDASCEKFNVVGLFCAPHLDVDNYYSCVDPTNGESSACNRDVDTGIRNYYANLQNYFNQTISADCANLLSSFVCQPFYLECDDNGETERSCDNQCKEIADVCGSNACFDNLCNQQEYSTCGTNALFVVSPIVLLFGLLAFFF